MGAALLKGDSLAPLVPGVQASRVIMGGAGSGKTWALQQVVSSAVSAGIRVLSARAHPSDGHRPNALIENLSEAHGGTIDHLRGNEAEPLAGLLDRLAEQPTLLALDDLQWADPGSVALIGDVCRWRGDRPIAIAATTRSWPPRAARHVADWAHWGVVDIQQLGPLPPADVEALIREGGGARLSPAAQQTVASLCNSNPRLLRVVLDALPSAGAGRINDAAVISVVGGLAVRVQSVLCLPESVSGYLQAGCVLGQRFRPELVVEMVGERDSGYDALDCLCRLDVLRQGPGRALEFTQPIVARLLYRELSASERVRLHARAFAALAGHGFERRAANHALLGNLSGNREAIDVLSRVGQAELREGDHDQAAIHFRAALELASDRPSGRISLALADALLRGGKPQDAAEVVGQLLLDQEAEPRQRIDGLRFLARALSATGVRQGATARLEEAVAIAARVDPDRQADVLLELILVSIREGRLEAARAHVDQALRLPGTPGQAADLTLCDSLLRASAAQPGAIDALQKQAFKLFDRSHDCAGGEDALASMAGAAVVVLAAAGTPATADRFVTSAVRQLEARSKVASGGVLYAYRAVTSLRMGRFDVAAEAAASAMAAAERSPGDLALALAVNAHVLLYLDRDRECRSACGAAAEQLADRVDPLARLWLSTVSAREMMIRGDLAEAAEIHQALTEAAGGDQGGFPGTTGWECAAVVSLVMTGRHPVARRLTDQLEAVGSSLPHPWASMVAAAGRGLLAEAAGQQAIASTELYAAATMAFALGPIDHVTIMTMLGSYLRRVGQSAEARRVLGEAADVARRSGGRLLERLAASERDVAGARGRRRLEPSRLTPQESRVAELAAAGRSNREIASQLWITVNTVETHLQRAYAKLGIKTRMQLRALQSESPEPSSASG